MSLDLIGAKKGYLVDSDGNEVHVEQDVAGHYVLGTQAHDVAQGLFSLGKLFHVTTDVLSISGVTESDLMYVTNPTGSDVLFLLYKLFMESESNTRAIIRMYKNPTITDNGIALVPNSMNDLLSETPEVLAYKAPTASVKGEIIHPWLISPGTAPPSQVIDMGGSYTIKAGSSLLFTVVNANNADSAMSVIWGELATT